MGPQWKLVEGLGDLAAELSSLNTRTLDNCLSTHLPRPCSGHCQDVRIGRNSDSQSLPFFASGSDFFLVIRVDLGNPVNWPAYVLYPSLSTLPQHYRASLDIRVRQ
jgi:hypothetical protein